MNKHRRALGAFLVMVSMGAFPVWAAQPVVEIIAFAHPPVRSALKPLRDWLAAQAGKVRVIETDMESAAGEKRAAAVGVTGHVPILLLVNGKFTFVRKDGTPFDLKSFPAGPGAPGAKGAWTTEDAKSVISAAF